MKSLEYKAKKAELESQIAKTRLVLFNKLYNDIDLLERDAESIATSIEGPAGLQDQSIKGALTANEKDILTPVLVKLEKQIKALRNLVY